MVDKINVTVDDLEIREIGSWPIQFRIAALGGVFLAALVIAYFIILKDSVSALATAALKQNKLRASFVDNYGQAANLNSYKSQMVEIQKMLQTLLQKLPGQGEIPALLEDISQQALSAGLEFELIKPEEPVDKGFYFEQPIKMVLTGRYHGFGNFTTGLSKLPRIVTLHNFSIKKKIGKEDFMLSMEIYAKTYWYVSKEKL